MQRRLGRGLESLIPTVEEAQTPDRMVPIQRIAPNPDQPRKHFDPDALQELAASIREHGIVQPLVVTEKSGGYELIVGERRLQAAKLAGLTEVPVIIRSANEQQKLELAMVENVQRRDLSPLEEARAYRRLIDEFNLTQEEVADKVGKSRVAVANTLRLLRLPLEVQEALGKGEITEGHGRAILVAPEEAQLELFRRVVAEQMTVREVERAARLLAEGEQKGKPALKREERLTHVENALRERFGSRVAVSYRAGKGQIKIEFYSQEELERLLGELGIELN